MAQQNWTHVAFRTKSNIIHRNQINFPDKHPITWRKWFPIQSIPAETLPPTRPWHTTSDVNEIYHYILAKASCVFARQSNETLQLTASQNAMLMLSNLYSPNLGIHDSHRRIMFCQLIFDSFPIRVEALKGA